MPQLGPGSASLDRSQRRMRAWVTRSCRSKRLRNRGSGKRLPRRLLALASSRFSNQWLRQSVASVQVGFGNNASVGIGSGKVASSRGFGSPKSLANAAGLLRSAPPLGWMANEQGKGRSTLPERIRPWVASIRQGLHRFIRNFLFRPPARHSASNDIDPQVLTNRSM